MNKKQLRKRLNGSGKRGGLHRRAKALVRKAGHNPNAPGMTVARMVSLITGKGFSQRNAWLWLLEESEGFIQQTTNQKTARKAILDNFCSRPEWRKLRFEALRESNGACCLCGRSNREHGVVLHVDHIKPKSLYPELALTLSNLQVLCEDCNMGKGNRDETDWREATETDRKLDAVDWRYV